MPNVSVFDINGKKVSDIALADSIFGIEPNVSAMHLVVVNYLANQRQGTQSTLTRSEVSGGGKKPWRQKGTGRARQGSSRAVQYRGGGIAFGPTPRSHTFKLNRKVRRLALRSGLTLKAQANEMFVLDSIAMDAMKTKEFVKVLGGFKADRKSLFVVDIEDDFDNAYMASRNIPGVVMVTVEGLNIYDLQNADKLFMTKKAALKTQEVLSND